MAGDGLFGRLQAELEGRDKAAGLSMADVLTLPDPLRRLVNWLLRKEEAGLAEVARQLGEDEESARVTVAELVRRGFVREIQVRGEKRFRVRLASARRREVPLDLWRALDERAEDLGEGK